MATKKDVKSSWREDEVKDLVMRHLFEMWSSNTKEGVDVAVKYAKFMSGLELDPDNYPVFMTLMKTGNHWVIDAMLGGKEPDHFFSTVQPNTYILSECFKMLKEKKPGEICPKLLVSILAVLKVSFEDPELGLRLFPINADDVNDIGKHLDDSQPATEKANQLILHILDSISSLNTPGGLPPKTKEFEMVATQSNNIRGKFLDPEKKLSDAIPVNVLVRGDYKKSEVAPTSESKGT